MSIKAEEMPHRLLWAWRARGRRRDGKDRWGSLSTRHAGLDSVLQDGRPREVFGGMDGEACGRAVGVIGGVPGGEWLGLERGAGAEWRDPSLHRWWRSEALRVVAEAQVEGCRRLRLEIWRDRGLGDGDTS